MYDAFLFAAVLITVAALVGVSLLTALLIWDWKTWRARRSARTGAYALLALLTAACGSTRSPASPLTLSWTDNTAGVASTLIERRASPESAFAPLASVPPGASEYIDAAVVAGERYCYRALAVVGERSSEYSIEACSR